MNQSSKQSKRAILAARTFALALIAEPLAVSGTTEQAPPRPPTDIVHAISLADVVLAKAGKISNYSIVRAWLVSGSKKEESKWMIVCRLDKSPKQTDMKKWIMIEVGPTGKTFFRETIPDWATPASQVLAEKPLLDVKSAIEAGMKYAAKKNEISNFYIDRVWLGQEVAGTKEKWVMSLTPDPDMDPTAFWFKVSINMQGKAEDSVGDVKWLMK